MYRPLCIASYEVLYVVCYTCAGGFEVKLFFVRAFGTCACVAPFTKEKPFSREKSEGLFGGSNMFFTTLPRMVGAFL